MKASEEPISQLTNRCMMRLRNDVKRACNHPWRHAQVERCASANRSRPALFHLSGDLDRKFWNLLSSLPRYHFGMRHFLSTSRCVALGCALGLGLTAPYASALFIVNQPWIRPAQQAQATEAYMNLTSTD